MPVPLRLSMLENRPERIDKLLEALRRSGFECTWQQANNEPDFLAQLDTFPQIVLASYGLPDLSAQRALQILQGRASRIPLIVIGDSIGEEAAVACLKQGAADYLSFDHLARLGEAIQQALAQASPPYPVGATPEEVYRGVISVSLDAIVVTDALGRVTFVSPSALEIFGLDSIQEAQGQNGFDWIAPGDRERAIANFRLTLMERPRFNNQYTMRRKDGSTFIAEINSAPFYDDAGNIKGVVAFIRDITERKRAENALRESEEKFRSLFEQSKDAILITTPPGEIRAYNPAALDTFGYTAEEMASLNAVSLYVDPKDRARLREVIAVEGTLNNREVRMKRKDGTLLFCLLSATAWRAEDGAVVAYEASFRDITERKQIEETLYYVAQRGWTSSGQSFFHSLVRHLAKTLDMSYAFMGEVVPDKPGFFRTLAFWAQDRIVDNVEYALKGTPCEIVIGQGLCSYPRNVRQQFPQDPLLVELGAESYIGIPLWDSAGKPLGGIAILDRKPVIDQHLAESLMQIVAVSAAHELERQHAEAALRESEEKHRHIIESIPMGMHMYQLEADGRLIFTGANPAAKQILGIDHRVFVGKTIEEAFPSLVGTETPERYREAAAKGKNWHAEQINYEDQRIRGVFEVYAFQTSPGKMAAAFWDITGRKKTEEALRQSEARYRLLAENATDIISGHDVQGNYIYISPAVRTILGYEPEELLGTSPYDLFHPDDAASVRESHDSILESPDTSTVSYRIRRKDGSYTWLESTSRTVRDPQTNAIQQIITISRDVTARKQAEQVLQQYSRRMALLHEIDRDILAARSPAETAQAVARHLKQMFALWGISVTIFDPTREEGLILAVEADDAAQIRAGMTVPTYEPQLRNIRQGTPLVVEDTTTLEDPSPLIQTLTSRGLHSYVNLPLIVQGELIGALTLTWNRPGVFSPEHVELAQEVADQLAIAIQQGRLYEQVQHHAAEMEQRVIERTQELAQERAQLQTILDSMNEGVAYIDLETSHTRYVNRAFSRLIGHAPEAIIGQSVDTWGAGLRIIDGSNVFIPTVLETIRQRNTWRGEVDFKRPDGSELVAEIRVTAVHDSGGKPVGAVVLVRDIGQEKALQAQKDRFIASASHELRSPVTNINMRLYLARKQPENLLEHLNAVERAARNLARLVEDLLDVSRFDRGAIALDRQIINLQDLILDAIDEQAFQATAKHIALIDDIPESPLYARVDPDRIVQVINNLVVNAINYTPEGGQVRVQLMTEEAAQGHYAVINVQDTGIGIPPETLKHLFEPFCRAADNTTKGTGLGLAITKEIVELHGGNIQVESQVGVGSTFSIRLPLD